MYYHITGVRIRCCCTGPKAEKTGTNCVRQTDSSQFMGNAFLNRMTVLPEFKTAIMAIPKTDIYKFELKTGDTEGLVNYLLSIEGIKFAAIVIDREEERKWSFRSKGNFDVNIFARTHFEGGGHANAAGGRSSKSVDETFNDFKNLIENYKSQLTQL